MDNVKSQLIVALVTEVIISMANSQSVGCSSDWYTHGGSCYQFNGGIPKTYEAARISCTEHGAGLVSVGSRPEHEFLVKWLQVLDSDLNEWYTSGTKEARQSGTVEFVWQGSGETISEDAQFWTSGLDFNHSVGVIVYKMTDGAYSWGISDPSEIHPFVCELPEGEAYRIHQHFRDFDYGLYRADLNELERGPHFILQPHNTILVRGPPEFALECVAVGLPRPTYSWWKGEHYEVLMTREMDPRYTFTNGKLIIANPTESKDTGQYRCQAENKFGVIIGDGITISFGDLGEFSNVPDAPVNAYAYEGAAIDCSKVSYKPAVMYQWFKRDVDQFVRPQFQKYIFISQNGKLYFSEVTRVDEGKYFCMAILTGLNQHTIGTSQPPTRTSLPIMLQVHDKAPIAEWGPVIQNEFIAVYPKPPMVGQDVKLECFAYGSLTTEFQYSWRRANKPMPKKSFMTDHNRLLVLRDATLDDQGVYTCTVSRGTNSKDEKSVDLKLGAKPYFISPLRDQHADIGAQLTWRCVARASPAAHFQWYKNGHLLHSDTDNYIKVVRNVLIISHLDPDLHNGMYQCAAINNYGTTMSVGQLRVLAIPPNFFKYPMQSLIQTSITANLSLLCRPEGAPLPEITWLKNGVELALSSDNVVYGSRGQLLVRNVNREDSGRYTCRARNVFGEAEESTFITVSEGISITLPPQDETVSINSTVFLYCQASHAKKTDLVYTWLFNGHEINIFRNPEYRLEQGDESGRTGLYIIAAGFHNAGYYECLAMTTINSDKKGAFLSVVGPPSEPAGIIADARTITSSSVVIRWSDGTDNGRPITNYIIEVADVFETNEWKVAIGDFTASNTLSEDKLKRSALVTHLNPGCGYRFRLIAVNQFGPGAPSIPSVFIQMLSAAPIVAPSCVGGGDGSVGDLMMTWMPLSRAQQAGEGIGYRLYWRRHTGREEDIWTMKELPGQYDQYITQVGADNYYLEYDFKIQAFNKEGYGPNSSQVIIMSAEDMPIGVATGVAAQGYNGTAVEVWWTPVPQERQYARGKILGYQINYWHEEEELTDWKDFIRHQGQIDTGLVIGLKSDDFYYFTIQVYNSAGLGPMSEYFFQETLHFPIAAYPEEIRVYSAGGHHVEVWWRGIHIIQQEGNIYGFVIFYWPANEPYRTACQHVIHDHHAHHAHIEVDPGVVYAIRVCAFGEGGYGKKSLTTYFTLEGNNILIDYNLAQTVEAFRSPASTPSGSIIVVMAACFLYIYFINTLLS